MAKLKIKKIELVAAKSQKNEILAYLQRSGAVEINVPDDTDGLVLSDCADASSENEKNSALIKSAYDALKPFAVVKKPLTAMLEPRKELDEGRWAQRAEGVGSVIEKAEYILGRKKQLEDLSAENVRLKTLSDELEPWLTAENSLAPGKTAGTAYFTGLIRKPVTREELLCHIARELPQTDCVDIEMLSSGSECTCFTVYSLKDDTEEIELALRSLGFMRAPETGDVPVKELNASYLEKIDENNRLSSEIKTELSEMADFYDEAEFALDNCSLRRDILLASEKIPSSETIFYLTGFAEKRAAEKIGAYLEKNFTACCEVSEPAEGEDVPVLLSNNAFSAPLENITGMYSLPSGADIDPTGIMAFFYYFFFGMMLSDAGYGMLMVLACGGLLLFKRNMERKWKNTLKMYMFCGLSTVFWGAMYGSWFGDAASVICTNFLGKPEGYTPAFFKPLWTDAVTDLMNVLIACFLLGLVHLFTGVLLKGITDLKNGHKFDAFCDTVPTFLTVIGIAPVFFNLFIQDTMPENYSALGTVIFKGILALHNGISTVSTPLLIAGLVLVVATGGRSAKSIAGKIGGGLYEVYNLVGGYLGDVLSYARLLALGLATGVIAQVMNMLGTLPQSQPLKTIVFVLVFIVGHIANLAINVIGAYVHTNRLQYVEFFGKFYEGGGRALVPLAANTNYYKFKEENQS